MRSGLCLLIMTLLGAHQAVASPEGGEAAGRIAELETQVALLEAQLALRPLDISAYELPQEVTFCGQRVNMADPSIHERMEKEFYIALGDRAQVVLWMKRARRVFPVIEEALERQGACPDLKYLAVVESGLRPAVTSRAAARGLWQFLAGTGRQYGLQVDKGWDERADYSKASEAGIAYLMALHKRFGSWPLAMAGYNTGPNRLARAMAAQGQTDFWALDLYTEAERYVPRIIAVKSILSNLGDYGFHITRKDGWAPLARDELEVSLPEGDAVTIPELGLALKASLRALRLLNPELTGDALPQGRRFTLKVPKGQREAARRWLEKQILANRAKAKARAEAKVLAERAAAARRAREAKAAQAQAAAKKRSTSKKRVGKRAPIKHKVRAGESLWSIAQRYGVEVAQLRSWNKLSREDVLRVGQRLIVRRG